MAIGTPITFYWTDGIILPGLVASAETTDGTYTYNTLVLFDPASGNVSTYTGRQATDNTPGSFQAAIPSA